MRIQRERIVYWLDIFVGIVAGIAFANLVVQWGFQLERFRPWFNRIDAIVLIIFLIELVIRYAVSPDKKHFFRTNWLNFIVLVPLIQYIQGIRTARFFIVLRQIIVFFTLFSRTKRLHKLINLFGLKPAQLMVTSFVFTILVGAFLLTLPISTAQSSGMGFVDALFTATSATCVTGLAVKDTGTFFSLFGQLVILVLIQIGALGIMTFSVTLFMAAGRRMSRKDALTMQDVLDQDSISDIIGLLKFIAGMTIGVEVLGAVFLYFALTEYLPDPAWRLYTAFFHSISAFCNAGFSLFSDSLSRFRSDVVINIVISALIILGGLGFIVIKDVRDVFIRPVRPRSLGLRTHTKIVLLVSVLLTIAGAVAIFGAERGHSITGLSPLSQWLSAFFQSVSARTAGFNSIDIGAMSSAGVVSLMVLMFIGASSGSTGGGIKTTTFWIILKTFTAYLRSEEDINIFHRKIPALVVGKAFAIFVLSLSLVAVFTYLLCALQPAMPFRDILFEVVSAFGTVGLSCGITGQLTVPGKLLITALMLLGRLGPLTMVLAFSRSARKINYTYAEERIMVG